MSERCQTKAVIRGKEVRCAEIDGHGTAHVFYPGERGKPAAEPQPEVPSTAITWSDEIGPAQDEKSSGLQVLREAMRGIPAAAPAPAALLDVQEKATQWLRDHWNERWMHTTPSREDNHTRDMANFAADEVKAELARLTAELEQVKAERDLANRHAADLFKRLQAAEASHGAQKDRRHNTDGSSEFDDPRSVHA